MSGKRQQTWRFKKTEFHLVFRIKSNSSQTSKIDEYQRKGQSFQVNVVTSLKLSILKS